MTARAGLLLVTWLAGIPALLACNPQKRQCEHGRDVFMDYAKTQLDDALAVASAEEKAALETAAAAELERGREVFVDECMKLDGPARACVDRIDALVEIDRRRKAAHQACPLDEFELPDLDCLGRANAAADAELGECEEHLRELGDAVWRRAAGPSE